MNECIEMNDILILTRAARVRLIALA